MRAIHVADYGTERIYYLVDKEQDHDGVILRPKQEPVFTDLWSYVTRVSGDVGWRKITDTRFHHFFWYGQNGKLAKRWRRVFQEHSMEPRKELLLSVPIVTDFPQNEKRKRATEKRSNRAIEFKTLTAAGLHEKALGRRIGRAGRGVAQRMMRSADFDPNPIDADLDMLVQEGTLWERPATPGAPHVPGVSGRRLQRRARGGGGQPPRPSQEGFASERGPERGWDWRSVVAGVDADPDRRIDGTAGQLRARRLQKFKAIEDHFSDGEPITGKRHARELVASAHVGFREGTSVADFLGDVFNPDATNRSDVLTPIEKEMVYALLHELLANPNLQDADFEIASLRTRRGSFPAVLQGHETLPLHGGFIHYEPGSSITIGEDGLPVVVPTRRVAITADAPGRELRSTTKPLIKIGYRDIAPEGDDGWRDHDPTVDTGFDPRARPIRPLGQGTRVGAREDSMSGRVFYTLMDELNSDAMLAADGWEKDPDDNFRTPDSRTGAMRPTERSHRWRKQYEEASVHATGIDMHTQMSQAAHFVAMRKLLMKALEERVKAEDEKVREVPLDVPGPDSPDADVVAWMRQRLRADEVRTLGVEDPENFALDLRWRSSADPVPALNKLRRAFGLGDTEVLDGRQMPKGPLSDQEPGYNRLLQVLLLAGEELQEQGPGLSEYREVRDPFPEDDLLEPDTRSYEHPIGQLHQWVATESVAAMSPRQQRTALQDVSLAVAIDRFEAVDALAIAAQMQVEVQVLSSTTRMPDGTHEITDQILMERARDNRVGLAKWMDEEILGDNGEKIEITEELADFINSNPGFRITLNDEPPGPEVEVGNGLTRGHVMAIFGARAYLDHNGAPLAGHYQHPSGQLRPAPVPVWSLPGLAHAARPAKYGGTGISPLSGRALMTADDVHFIDPSHPALADLPDRPTEAFPAGVSTTWKTDALSIMLRDGTPEIQTFGTADHVTGEPLQWSAGDGEGAVLDRPEVSGPVLIPALSKESVGILVDGLARTVGQVPDHFMDLEGEDITTLQIGERMTDIASDAVPHIAGGGGENLLPFIGSGASEDAVATQLQNEISENLQGLVTMLAPDEPVMPAQLQEVAELYAGPPPDPLASILELTLGNNMFFLNELNDEERDAITDLIDNLTFEGELLPLNSDLDEDMEKFRDVLRGGGIDFDPRRKVAWTSWMGQKENVFPPWMKAMGVENQTFLAELMTAHLMGGEIRTKITEFQLEVLRKLTKWLKEKQQFTAKVNLVNWDEEMWEQLGGSS